MEEEHKRRSSIRGFMLCSMGAPSCAKTKKGQQKQGAREGKMATVNKYTQRSFSLKPKHLAYLIISENWVPWAPTICVTANSNK